MTAGFLAEIFGAVRRDVEEGVYDRAPPPGSGRSPPSLARALRPDAGGLRLLAELKRVSPGRAKPELPVRSVAEFLEATDDPSVVGYSCLATRPRFQGDPDLVAELARGTTRPVLFKDFVLDPRQIRSARRAGAAAVLLIARLETEGLLDRSLAELAQEAHREGLEVLLELHRESEAVLLASVRADVVGVNARDLDTLRLEPARALATCRSLAPRLSVPLLGLSGVEGPEEARAFADAGCHGVLVGSAVALSADPGAFLRSLAGAGATR